VKINPSLAEAYFNLGQIAREEGDLAEAAREYEAALRIYPDHYLAHFNLGGVYWLLGRRPEALEQMEATIRSDPGSADAMNNLAWWLAAGPDASYRNGARAVELAERACELTGYKKPLMIGTLAAAYAEAGRFKDAVTTAERAKAVAEQQGDKAIAAKNSELEELYRAGKPFHESSN
jgi:tetratricopeptide (TPR) repeat protein